ncbi:nmrA-like family protein-like protein [Stipitochalara longipes BDJ]|nr:nmrA-like family protein-like protein [Stipitochalara longipes BDJ]
MVHIVVAGGTGDVAGEIVALLVKQKKHKVTIFTRKDSSTVALEGVTAVQIDYTDKEALTKHLHGVDTVLSFILETSDPSSPATRNLIDASIASGVKRFAPNEWAARSHSGMPWYASKDIIHKYLQQVNIEKKVLQYTLFQPGIFLNYFTYPYRSCEHLKLRELQIDFQNSRAIVLGNGDDRISLTTVEDLAAFVAAAIDYEGEWPEVGGVCGGRTTFSDLIKFGEEIRGKSFTVTRLSKADVEAGDLKTEWIPSFTQESGETLAQASAPDRHPREAISRVLLAGSLLATAHGAWDTSDEWNLLLPELKLTGIEEFLRQQWKEKP